MSQSASANQAAAGVNDEHGGQNGEKFTGLDWHRFYSIAFSAIGLGSAAKRRAG